ncbi:MAG: hypothetical protein OHK0045_22830 [Raineya sp.]
MSSPKTIVNISDLSNLKLPKLQGVACVQGVTTMGELRKPILITSWEEFEQIYGAYHPDSLFPFYCEQALKNGAKLYVSRVAHYSDLEDLSTVEGDFASVSVGTNIVARGLHIGIGYNDVKVTISNGTNASTQVNITIQKGKNKQELFDVPRNGTTLKEINALLGQRYGEKLLVVFTTSIGTKNFTNGTYTLTGGNQDINNITDADYIGEKTTNTGWFAFDEIVDSTYIFNFDRPVPEVDIALAEYCKARKDMRFVIRTPVELNALGMEEYRMGTGAYSHTPIDTFLGKLVVGDIRVDYKGQKTIISPIAEVCALQMKKQFEWFSTAGPNRGKLSKAVLGSPYNLLSPALQPEYDNIYQKGINAVGIHKTFGAVFWGNRTLLLDETKLLKFDNVADLAMYVRREILAIVENFNFEPNDLLMFAQLYNAVLPFIESLEAGRAIHPTKWQWIGDQFASKVEELQYNTPDDVQVGKYKARFLFAPIVSNEFVEIEAGVSDLGAFAEIV